MQARTRFMLAVVVLFLLMTGPFLLTALIVWVETAGEAREMLVKVLSPHLTLGTLLTAMGFAAGVGVVRVLFRQQREQCALAAAVGANQAESVACANAEFEVIK